MKNSEQPAFGFGFANEQSHQVELGLTKREYFAAMAMQGLCAAFDKDGTWTHDETIVAKAAVSYADALLTELDKTK